jgi:glutathione S-transferase
MGDALTRADLAWLPFVELATRGGVPLEDATPSLRAWRDRMRTRPSYERSYPPHWRT